MKVATSLAEITFAAKAAPLKNIGLAPLVRIFNVALATDIPTNVSALENDKDYIVSSGIEKITRIEIVPMLPETEEEGVLYIVKE